MHGANSPNSAPVAVSRSKEKVAQNFPKIIQSVKKIIFLVPIFYFIIIILSLCTQRNPKKVRGPAVNPVSGGVGAELRFRRKESVTDAARAHLYAGLI